MRIKIPCCEQISSNSCNSKDSNGIWSNRRTEISFSLLQKFWSELSLKSRKELLKVDKQTLFEQARKNMYCSRCNGLLLDFYVQIVAHGKSMPQVVAGIGVLRRQKDGDCLSYKTQDDVRDPALCPWGGLAATRDGWLTLLDCYLCSKSLKALQNVFDSARARERERELLYPDGCGGGGRGWISQGVGSYGRGHGTRETCALHTARLSCDTLVDFWSALGEETQFSLLRMKEEDFVERLVYRFDSKRFCRDCRKNVIREFKELKELKRSRRDPRCTSWFCGADTAFQYEVSDDMIQADWGESFGDLGIYHHFEWAVGTGEGKSDILEFENVGMNRSVCVDGLDLCGLNACFITLRAWRIDGRCTEHSVKAHALRGLHCVHSCLVVGDGYVSITSRQSIRRFFEHAEEAEDEEDDDSMERDGNDLDGECSRPQKHAKSPELAREFLLDAATVIFKDQIEKAFREGTARQNAHIMFISLALQLLEERLHVACKEIITLEKQVKLLEEEEIEKREEKERKEKRKAKEKEKKLRRKERLKGKEKDKEKSGSETVFNSSVSDAQLEESIPSTEDHNSNALSGRDSATETVDVVLSRYATPETQDLQPAEGYFTSNVLSNSDASTTVKDGSDSFTTKESNYTTRRQKHHRDDQGDSPYKWSDQRRVSVVSENGYTANRPDLSYYDDNNEAPSSAINGSNRQARFSGTKSSIRSNYVEKISFSRNKTDRYDDQICSCNRDNGHRAKAQNYSAFATCKEAKSNRKSESALDMSKQYNRGSHYTQAGHMHEIRGRTKSKFISGSSTKDLHHSKKVWEHLELEENYPCSNSDYNVAITTASKIEVREADGNIINSSDACSSELSGNSDDSNRGDKDLKASRNLHLEKSTYSQNRLQEVNDICHVKESTGNLIAKDALKTSPLITAHQNSCSNFDNCLSCLSEGDSSNTASSNHTSSETSSASDSEGANQLEERRETRGIQNGFSECHNDEIEKNQIKSREQSSGSAFGLSQNCVVSSLPGHPPTHTANIYDSGKASDGIACQPQSILPQVHKPYISFPMFQPPSAQGYYHQPRVTWPVAPAGGFVQVPHPNQYLYTGSLGYGLNGHSNFYMQPLQDIATPLSYLTPPPVYQAGSRSSRMTPEEKREICNSSAVQQQANGPNAEELVAAGARSMEAPSRKEDGIKSSGRKHDDSVGFSLFHFGCHVPLSTANKSGHVLSKDEIIGKFSAKFSCCHSEANKSCIKKETTGEEYNLFAPRNGMKFSLF